MRYSWPTGFQLVPVPANLSGYRTSNIVSKFMYLRKLQSNSSYEYSVDFHMIPRYSTDIGRVITDIVTGEQEQLFPDPFPDRPGAQYDENGRKIRTPSYKNDYFLFNTIGTL